MPGHKLRIAQPVTWPATMRAGYRLMACPAESVDPAGLDMPVPSGAGPNLAHAP